MTDFSDWDHEGFDLETFVDHFREEGNPPEGEDEWDIDALYELYQLLEDYYGEDWLLEIDFNDDDFWDLFRELYDHTAG